MIINTAGIAAIFRGLNTSFRKGFTAAPSHRKDVATVVPSATREETYAWLGEFPDLREWIGDRIIRNLAAHSYTLANRKFESTIPVKRDDIKDDRYGVFAPLSEEMGRAAATHPDSMVFSLLGAGLATACYDGRPFFDVSHPVKDTDGSETMASNVQAGTGTPWFLLDCSRPIRPFLFQERRPYQLTTLDKETDANVFMREEYICGVTARVNAGFGPWQFAHASRADPTADNHEAARAAMMSLKADGGSPPGIRPDTLVVPPSLEGAAMRLLNNGMRVVTIGDDNLAVTNEWAARPNPSSRHGWRDDVAGGEAGSFAPPPDRPGGTPPSP